MRFASLRSWTVSVPYILIDLLKEFRELDVLFCDNSQPLKFLKHSKLKTGKRENHTISLPCFSILKTL